MVPVPALLYLFACVTVSGAEDYRSTSSVVTVSIFGVLLAILVLLALAIYVNAAISMICRRFYGTEVTCCCHRLESDVTCCCCRLGYGVNCCCHRIQPSLEDVDPVSDTDRTLKTVSDGQTSPVALTTRMSSYEQQLPSTSYDLGRPGYETPVKQHIELHGIQSSII